nr:hypothetical protein [Tanacetum cinerariifolium]
MADQRTMAQLLQAPIEGYEDAIVVPAITVDNFELKHGLLTRVQNKEFFGHDKEDPHAHVRYFNMITSTLKFSNVPNTSIKLMLFPFSLEGAARIWLEKEPPRSIFTWDDLRFDESFSEAWDRFKDLFRACPHHVRYSHNKPVVAKVSTNTSTSDISPDVAELKDMVKALLLDKKSQNQAPATVKAVEESCVTCGGAHPYPYQAPAYQAPAPQTQGVLKDDFSAYVKANDAVMRNMQTQGQNMQNQLTNLTELITKFVNSNSATTSSSSTLPSNIMANPRSDLKAITTQSGMSYDGPQISPPPSFLPKVVQSKSPILTSEPVTSPISEPAIASVSAQNPNPKFSIPYPSRRNDERNRENGNNQIEKFYQIFKDMSFKISFADALILMPKFASTLKTLIGNKEKLSEMARTLLNEHCFAMAECLALADLGASINLMPWSVWKRLFLPNLTPTCMILELSDRLISRSVGVAEDVYVKVGSFHFSSDFVVVDFDADPRVPLILGRSFLKTRRALIDVFEGELTLRVGKEVITFNLDQTLRYSANYSDMTAKRIDVIDMACKEYSKEVLRFSDVVSSGNPTPYHDPIVFPTSLTLTSFRNNDFLLEEVDAFLAIKDDPSSLKELKICEAKSNKSSINEPPEVELKDLPPHLEYAFLEGDEKFPVIIAKDLSMEEKTTLITVLKSHKRVIAWKLFDIKGTLQRCMMAIFHDMIKKTMEVFMDEFSIFGNSFQSCLSYIERMLKRCEDTNLCLNWEKSHFMVKEGIVLGHKISKQGIEVDKAKVDVITKLPHPTTVKGIQSFLEHKAYWALKHANFDLKTAGDHKKVQINELNELRDQAYENSLIYKEKTKRLHDSKIKDRVFNIGDRLLLFNSRLKIFSGKLKSRCSGPFIISQVYPYGTVELSQPNGPNFKVNGHRLKHYFGEDVPKVVVLDLQTFPRDH